MIFASDLDRTLIFSQRRLDPDGPAVIPVEYRLGEPFGFMTPGAWEALRQIQSRAVFFLNTLRGLEQAKRVGFVDDGGCPYLSLQNGLYLYRKGELDTDWAGDVRRRVNSLPLGLEDGSSRVLDKLPGISCLSKQYEYLSVFFVDDRFDDSACLQLGRELAQCGWSLCRQGSKLYLSPLEIHKGAVLERVRQWEDGADAIGFGDSAFDLPMLRACQERWSLRGCELWGQSLEFSVRFSSSPAQAGTEEVLTQICHTLENSRGR